MFYLKHRASVVGDDIESGGIMREPQIDDRVRLTQDLPELSLTRGTVGVVRSTWFAPTTAYEVEFEPVGLDHCARALLLANQVEVDEGMVFADEHAGAHQPTA
jgi:hypothetical protein